MNYALYKVFLFSVNDGICCFCIQQGLRTNMEFIWQAFLPHLLIHWCILLTCSIWTVLLYMHKGLLVGRALYSIQLKDYLEQKQNGKNRTCFMFFSRKKKNVQKELKKLKEKYTKGGSLFLQDVNAEFKFEKPDFE